MKTEKASKKLAKWLAYCLEIGWSKDHLDALEELWWKYHDSKTGELIQMNKKLSLEKFRGNSGIIPEQFAG